MIQIAALAVFLLARVDRTAAMRTTDPSGVSKPTPDPGRRTSLRERLGTLQAEGLSLQSEVLWNGTTSCGNDNPPEVVARVRTLCALAPELVRCLPDSDGLLLFKNCTTDACFASLNNAETVCISQFFGIDVSGRSESEDLVCDVPVQDADLFHFVLIPLAAPVSARPDGDCFLALPEESEVLVKAICVGGQPEVVIKWEFDKPLAAEPLGCVISATCEQKEFIGETLCWRKWGDGNGVPPTELQPLGILLACLAWIWMAAF